MHSEGLHTIAGYKNVEKLLRKLEFEGNMPHDINQLFAAIERQTQTMERAAQRYFFPRGLLPP